MFKKAWNRACAFGRKCVQGAQALMVAGTVAIAATASMVATPVQAALPAIVGTTLDSVETDALALVDLVWPIVVVLFGSILLIKLFKRAANKI